MNKSGPILIVEDNHNDQIQLAEIFRQLDYPNKVIFFEDGLEVLGFLRKNPERPFMIISEMDMPRMNGLQLRDKIRGDDSIQGKRIPYIFLSTEVTKQMLDQSYDMHAQGFFIKASSFARSKSTARKIIEYWKDCHTQNELPG